MHLSKSYTERAKLRKEWIRLSIGTDVLKQIICTIKIRAPTKHDNVDSKAVIIRISDVMPLFIGVIAGQRI